MPQQSVDTASRRSTSRSRTVTRRNRKIAALAAGVLVVGVGATYTLASWTDSEWVWGGADGSPAVGTSSFNLEQNTYGDGAAGTWVNAETEAEAGDMQFSLAPLALTPGDTVYAPVSLRADETSIGGSVLLNQAMSSALNANGDIGSVLWNAMELSVYTSDTADPLTCAATASGPQFDGNDWVELVATAPLSTAIASGAQAIAAGATGAAGPAQHYCFQLTLPETAQDASSTELMGRTIAPVWQFAATSN